LANQAYGWWLGQWDKQPSSFSTEDLVSDLVTFYGVVEDKDPIDLVNQYAGRFRLHADDEKLISGVIWKYGLACTSGNGTWTPIHYDDQGFTNSVLLSDINGKSFPDNVRDAAGLLLQYRKQYGAPKFPAYFQQYAPNREGFVSETYTSYAK